MLWKYPLHDHVLHLAKYGIAVAERSTMSAARAAHAPMHAWHNCNSRRARQFCLRASVAGPARCSVATLGQLICTRSSGFRSCARPAASSPRRCRPSTLPISARAIGEVIEILPSRTLASCSPTILYLTLSPESSSSSVTVAPNFTVLPRQLGRVDDLGPADLVLELGHLGLVEPLRLLGGMILGVLGQIAVLAGVRDLLDDARALLDLEAVQLGLELLEPLDGHRHFFHGHGSHSLRPARTERRHHHPVSLSLLGLASPHRAAGRDILRMLGLHKIAAAPP